MSHDLVLEEAAARFAASGVASTPSIATLIQSTRSSIALTDSDRDTAIDAMRRG
jgi:hypothetical protein